MGERRSDGMRVAVKTIPKRRLVYIDMLKNEIGILRALDNANIIKLLDEFEDEQQVHLVFELCMGGELFEPIADQGFRFTERQASRLVRKMLGAVKYCHDLNIVHRDLKPENILLTDPGVECELKVGGPYAVRFVAKCEPAALDSYALDWGPSAVHVAHCRVFVYFALILFTCRSLILAWLPRSSPTRRLRDT